MLEGQEGAANYQTDIGVFEALFLPRPERLNALEIVKQEETGGFIYSFRGRPRSLTGNWEGRRVCFVRQGSPFLHTLDKQVTMKFEEAFQSRSHSLCNECRAIPLTRRLLRRPTLFGQYRICGISSRRPP